MLGAARKNEILNILQNEKSVSVNMLSRRFNVSEETVRRDLQKLEKEGYIIKTHGGAMVKEEESVDLPFAVRKNKNPIGKKRIALIAAQLIKGGESIMLDPSSTAACFADALESKNVTIITNSVEVLYSYKGGGKVISTGGELDKTELIGTSAISSIKRYLADYVFFSAKGIDLLRGISETSDAVAAVKEAMLASAKVKVLMIDSSKFDKAFLVNFANFDNIDILITDKEPSKVWKDALASYGVKCLYPQ
jgi:DeoR/GlpR family transcriptional regulator of sugar metabolism